MAPPRPGTIPGQAVPGAVSGGTSIGTWITRILVTVIGLGGGLVILIGILIATGDPAACVDRRSTVSQSAVDALQLKWDTFKAAGPGASVQFSEAEVTSRGVAYVEERDVPIKDLQIYFCPDGTAEAKGKVNVLGRDVSVLARGTLDVSGGQNRIVVDELKAGNLPPWVSTAVVNQVIDRNNVRDLPLGITLASSISTDGVHTLTR
ncbi:MAG: hypothetical protein M9925_01150 [Chloroflexi bacterium]|nr:hypothetical protein [Chloroflexota bacterium]NJD64037.1 hypothetical protein [Chloroflexota bacterium]